MLRTTSGIIPVTSSENQNDNNRIAQMCFFVLLFTCAFLMPVHLAKPYIIARLDYLFQMFFFSNFKVSKEGEGLKKTWQQHFQQFRNVSAEMAAAIVAVYPSPQSLLQVI